MFRPALVNDAIVIDEVGIESGRYGGFHLKSAYQPVFRRDGATLVPFAVEGLIMPFIESSPVPPDCCSGIRRRRSGCSSRACAERCICATITISASIISSCSSTSIRM